MTMIYSTAAKAARMTAVRDLIDAGSTFGRIEIGTLNMGSTLVVVALVKPCGTVAGGVLTMSGFPLADTDADLGGTAASAQVVDSDGNVIISGLTVGVLTGDVRVDTVTILQHQTVSLANAVFTHAT